MSSTSPEAALVLFSGGQDSTVCLAWALERFARVETVGFDYGQRHRAELEARPRVRARLIALRPDWGSRLGEDHVVRLDALGEVSDTALTREVAIEIGASGLPTTFVPGRNLVFFAFAGALGYRRGTRHLVAGMCETDFSGYPDCRDDTVKAMQLALKSTKAWPPISCASAKVAALSIHISGVWMTKRRSIPRLSASCMALTVSSRQSG